LPVDLLCGFGFHLGLKCNGSGRLLISSDGPSPFRPFVLGPALIAQGTGATSCFRRFVYMPAHAIFLVGYDLEGELFPCRTEEDVPHSVVGKSATDKAPTTAQGILFGRLPTVLP